MNGFRLSSLMPALAIPCGWALQWALMVPLLSTTEAIADDAFGPTATWELVSQADARSVLDAYLEGKSLTEEQKKEIERLWASEHPMPDELAGHEILERFVKSLGVVEERPRALVEYCSKPFQPGALPDMDWLLDSETPDAVRNNARLYYASWLVQQELHDDALLMLTGLEPEHVVDPAGLLFCQAIVHHRLVNTEASRHAALRLLERESELPRRYQELAGLMKEDLQAIERESLDHISRRMSDIRRRLDLGQAGQKVIKVEDSVIASLDKMIKELEEQQQQQNPSGGKAGAPSSNPAQNSQVAPLKGQGKVDPKQIGNKADWGSLPPKQREAALQQIGKEFPAHFREAIEQYFRKIAGETEKSKN